MEVKKPHLHGDPRHYPEDIEKLKARIRELERENEALHMQLERQDWRSVGW